MLVEGRSPENVVQSFLVFNIRLNDLLRIAGQYLQPSVVYAYPTAEGVMSEYWAIKHADMRFDSLHNPYLFIDKTLSPNSEPEANDHFTLVGGDFNYAIDTSVIRSINEAIENNLDYILENYDFRFGKQEIVEWATNRVGQLAVYYRKLLYNGIAED